MARLEQGAQSAASIAPLSSMQNESGAQVGPADLIGTHGRLGSELKSPNRNHRTQIDHGPNQSGAGHTIAIGSVDTIPLRRVMNPQIESASASAGRHHDLGRRRAKPIDIPERSSTFVRRDSAGRQTCCEEPCMPAHRYSSMTIDTSTHRFPVTTSDPIVDLTGADSSLHHLRSADNAMLCCEEIKTIHTPNLPSPSSDRG